ncbi:MAG: acetate kinase [[Clostridium] spiroforme]|uniref:Acetate kinase n=1 Tax=Thomasclavelia spiroformis TaxID=29348 RepID=A0A943ENS0_9FIRM|nr:acetate kinase [Thomasclavelia spiroformis]MBS5587765.1 acetate kinase [Thomasclavelia spiroformis]
MVKVMAINAGSSSLKFQLINMPSEEVITSGIVERIGLEEGNFEMKYNGEKFTKQCPINDHSVAVQLLLDALVKHHVVENLNEIEACGHRIVHGGEYFSDSIKVDEDVVAKVEELAELAPLHNPAHIIGYNAFKNALPGVEHVFVFDTAFHQTLDQERYLYPLPMEYYKDLKVRKYGAHGTSHKYVSQVANEMLGKPEKSKIIVCHLGNGASISAVQDGVCIDTSMGFTPLAGVMMGTRCGDVDPSIMPYLCNKLNKTPDEMLEIYNKKSGMLGVSGISSDSRDIEDAFHQGDERAILTSSLYARIASKFIGSYFVEMGGLDAIAFTAGVGENAAYLRRLIVENIADALGAVLDDEANETRSKENRLISSESSKVKVMVIPTNEEVMIARDTIRVLGL